MPKSLPSLKFAIVDAPEISGLDVRFVYNFFVPDEAVNDSGMVTQKFIAEKTSIDFKESFIDSANFNRFVPRYNRISWTPGIVSRDDRLPNVSIAKNINKIYNETSFTIDQFSSVQFQDTNLRDRSRFFINRLAQEIDGRDAAEDFSLLDLVKIINEETPNSISAEIITQGLDDEGISNGHLFFDSKTGEPIKSSDNVFQESAQIGFRSQINNKVLSKIIKSSTNSVISTINQDLLTTLENAKQIQEKSIAQNPGTLLDGKDFDFEVRDFISVQAIDTDGFEPISRLVGYIINKTEITPDGVIVIHDPIIVESAFASTTVDLKIKYGSRYEYTIQSVALLQIQAEDALEGQIVAISFLVSSKPSFIKNAIAREDVPPPPPADFNVEWNYDKAMPRLSWNFPVNTQRDIKYFQVFKRLSTSEPFELVKMYDFDDSVILSDLRETPEIRLIEKVSSPRNYYHDYRYTFDKTGQTPSVIYAVCAVDAHGLSSGYSMQFRVRFDRFKNKLIKELVSNSGAPKAYPNMNLNTDTFVDSIRDSNHKKLRVVFNPEFLKAIDSKGNDLKLIKSGEGTKYRLQMINVDLQEQKVFDIEIKDLT
jgi:hypothetical protein